MPQSNLGASVYAVMTRVVLLENDGVPLNVTNNMYVTDALVKLEGTPQFTTVPETEILNAAGALCVAYKAVNPFKRVDLTMEICTIDPELENMLTGGELFTQSSFTVGGSAPPVGTVENQVQWGVSLEVWTKHIVNGDQDTIWPYIQWIWPRTRWQPDKITYDINHMPRLFTGFATQNPNYFNGPTNDWPFQSDRVYAWRFTKTVPVAQIGFQSVAHT